MQKRRNNVACLSWRTLCAAALFVVVSLDFDGAHATSSSSPRIFHVVLGAWSDCRPVNNTQACYRTRDAVCVRRTDNATAPWYYCTDIGMERPHEVEKCSGSDCVRDCAVTEWSSWSSCDNCSAGFFRYRTREIVLPPTNGGRECPELMEREKCINCFLENRPFETLPRTYTWRTGEWRTCTTLDDNADCGHGLQTRAVECVDNQRRLVNSSFCVSEEAAYLHVFPPATTRLCDVPCRCLVEEWSAWTQCTANCSTSPLTGYRRRTRSILRQPTLGETCPQDLEETQLCTNFDSACPSYAWETSGWSPCTPQSEGATCGAGLRSRFAYCVERRGAVSVSVDSSLCESSVRPSTLSSCEVSCHQDCSVGEWSDWSECSRACVPTNKNRTRVVLLPPLAGGEHCPHLVEYKTCPVVPCVSWVVDHLISSPCFPDDGNSCGVGTRTLHFDCRNLDGVDVGNSQCSSLPTPSIQEDCYKPCPESCVLSEWSDWSECSETCDGVIGTQSRQRKIIYQGTSCPFTDADLDESRNCSDPRPCVEDVYYILEDPWGPCTDENQLVAGSSSYCGVGVQNRTAVCMKGDNAIPPEECPIVYNEMLQRSCNMPCDPVCEYSEWTAYGECSVDCGSGVSSRTRRLLRYPSDATINCMVDEDGFQTETTPCASNPSCPIPDSDHAWYLDDYGECVLFPSVSSSGASVVGGCGHGYKNRTVVCRHLQTSALVDDERCLGNEEKPSTVAPCEVACQDQCIVTEWMEFSQCTADSDQHRSRDIVPCSRYGNLNQCCPKLSSLQLSETVTCNRPDLSRYILELTDRHGECIIIDPNESCGNGFEYAPYECVDTRDNYKVVPEDFCRLPESQADVMPRQPCSIRCDTDCELSPWSSWGACSVTCGRGFRRRTRAIMDEPGENGRPCGATEEVDICEVGACPYAEFIPGQFSNCILNNSDTNSTCGMGMRTRQAVCLIDGQLRNNSLPCEDLGATVTFDLIEPCEVPCSGDCVLSEWGAWSPCLPNGMGTWQQSRTRDKLTAINCPSDVMTRDYRSCPQYTWRAANWTDCIIPNFEPGDLHPNYYCGNGTQRRNISCTDVQNGLAVHDKLCEGVQKPAQLQSCSLPCPVDCVVGTFSEWTQCQRSCTEHVQTRERAELVSPVNGGRSCPTLTQERPCPVNCDWYVYESGQPRCSRDYSDQTQCGKSLKSQPISCRRNDVFVSPSECLEAASQGQSVEGLNSANENVNCTLDCPLEPPCNFTDWSEPSDCVSSCYDDANPLAFRTRKLIRSFEAHTDSCLASQYEYTNCPTAEPDRNVTGDATVATTTALAPDTPTECVAFSWQFSSWYGDDSRDVWCESNDGLQVLGGCPLNLMPLTDRYPCLSKECPSFSSCNSSSGLCQCVSDLEKVEDSCLPLRGCFEDGHCLIPNMQCDVASSLCVCSEGYELKEGVCTLVAPPSTTTTATTDSTATTTQSGRATTSPEDEDTTTTTNAPVTTMGSSGGLAANLGILEIVLIAIVPLVVVILTVIVLIFITYLCRVCLEKKHKATSQRRRATLSISSPSPCPQTQEEMNARLNRRGAESASSGFVDDLDNDLQKYGMPGNSFIASQHSKHSEDIDEDVFPAPNHLPLNPIPVTAPTVPAANPLHHHGNYYPHQLNESNLDGRMLNHQIVTPGTPFTIGDNYPDGDFTTATDVTYTTDEGSVTGTSVPPSSVGGSPNIMRRGGRGDIPRHLLRSPERCHRSSSRGTENQYVDMHAQQPVYASIKRGGHHHDYQHHPHHQPHPQEYHQDYRSGARSARSHDQSREASQDYLSDPDYARSITPTSPTGRYHPSSQSPTHIRDTRIATGLDNSMVRAAAQMTGPHSQEDQEFQRSYHRSSGSRRSSRRRRRRHHRNYGNNNPHHMTYHPSSRHDDYYYHDYHRQPVTRHYSEGDHYYHSDHDPQVVYPSSPGPHYAPSRSVPMTPVIPPGHQIPPHHHAHSPAVVHVHDQVHHGAVIQGHPPPHSPAVAPQGQHQYSHEPYHQPNIAVQPPTPASGRRDDIQATSQCSLPVTTPYQYHQPGGYNAPPTDQAYLQSTSTPNLPAHMVPQPSPHLNPPPAGRDSYENYDFPRKVHAHYTSQLRQEADTPTSSHYANPRSLVSSTSSVGGLPSPVNPVPPLSHDQYQPPPNTTPDALAPTGPQTGPYTSVSFHSDVSVATPHAVPSESIAVNPQTGSPYVVRRQHHTSPLALHSSSSNSPATSSVYTPRGSAEVQQRLSDTLSSVESPAVDHQTSLSGQHVQYQLHHQVEANGSVPVAVQQ